MRSDLTQWHAFAALARQVLDLCAQRLDLNDGEGEEAPYRAAVAACMAACDALPINVAAAGLHCWPPEIARQIAQARNMIAAAEAWPPVAEEA